MSPLSRSLRYRQRGSNSGQYPEGIKAPTDLGYNPDSKGYAISRIVLYRELKQPDVAYQFNFRNGRWGNLVVVNFRPVEMKCGAVVDGGRTRRTGRPDAEAGCLFLYTPTKVEAFRWNCLSVDFPVDE